MNYRMLASLFGTILLLESVLLLLPLGTAIYYGESVLPFLYTIAVLLLVSLPFALRRPRDTRIYAREGFVCVAASWILLSAFGALPFVIPGNGGVAAIPNYVDALFETVSGFTTTGASILADVESLPRGILLWRSLTHWVGGMGVLVFMLAILPSTDGRAIHLLRAEVPGPTKGKLVPKLRETALILYGIYVALTLIELVALLIAGMPFYDAVNTALATAGTGGFAVKNGSISDYHSPAVEWVISAFMLIFGVNFNLYYFLLIRRFRDVFRNEEFRVYLALTFGSITLIAINTWKLFGGNIEACLRTVAFQVTTIMSTCGFATTDYNAEWPEFSKTILVILMFVGASAGSTAGGLKVSRVMLLAKTVGREIKHMLRPQSVNVVRMDGEAVPEETVRAASNYFALYVAILTAATLAISVDNFGLETNFTAAVSCLNNIGPGLGMVGPRGNYGAYSYFSKAVLSLTMLFGRLEIMPMMILFSHFHWKRR